jgi:hypothetical protein
MSTKQLLGGSLVILCALVAVIISQQKSIARLETETRALRDQITQAEAVRAEDERLATEKKKAGEISQADKTELMRLRAQLARLRQVERENAQSQPARPRPQTAPAPEIPAPQPAEQAPIAGQPADTGSTPPASVNLGVVELTEATPMRLDLGAGRQCVVTASSLPDGNLQLVFASDAAAPDGTPTQVTQTVTVAPGGQLFSSINGVQVALKPVLKTQ